MTGVPKHAINDSIKSTSKTFMHRLNPSCYSYLCTTPLTHGLSRFLLSCLTNMTAKIRLLLAKFRYFRFFNMVSQNEMKFISNSAHFHSALSNHYDYAALLSNMEPFSHGMQIRKSLCCGG